MWTSYDHDPGLIYTKKKGRYLIQSHDKSPYTQRKKIKLTTQKRHQNVDYTTIAILCSTVSWGNDSHQTGVVKPVNGIPTFPLTAKTVYTHLNIYK